MSSVPHKTVLVVDDDKDNRGILTRLLKMGGYTPLMAVDGQQGLETAEREHPDLILLDITMPKMNGVEMFKRLRANPENRGMAVVFFSALTEGPLLEESQHLDVDDHILKGSVSGRELLARIARQLPTC